MSFCELFIHFKATSLLSILSYFLSLTLYFNGPSFHIAEYSIAESSLFISLILLNRLYGTHSTIVSK
jgi:hypothetical protein